jgi:hypothetical protein
VAISRVAFDEAKLKRQIRAHFRKMGFHRDADGRLCPPSLDKATYRMLHEPQKRERAVEERRFVERAWPKLKGFFATGRDVDPTRIRVRIELIESSCWQADLFRLACLLWSVPVSRGFGRRLRFLVWDDSNHKLIGLFALGDPVFNLKARDDEIGWTGTDRAQRLVNVLDAYVLGAVPPYNKLLGGKMVACLIRTREVSQIFRERYRSSEGIISGRAKDPQLVAVTTTSALGRSSIYNRLKLEGTTYFREIGFTTGYGHFHFPEPLFQQMRAFLRARGDRYAGNHGYGQGPNWRLRTIRRTLELLGLDPRLVKHGLQRQVFFCELADNAVAVLRGERKRASQRSLKPVDEVAALAIARWLVPRATRDESFKLVTHAQLLESMLAGTRNTASISEATEDRRAQRG